MTSLGLCHLGHLIISSNMLEFVLVAFYLEILAGLNSIQKYKNTVEFIGFLFLSFLFNVMYELTLSFIK